MPTPRRAPQNRTLHLSAIEKQEFTQKLTALSAPAPKELLTDTIINQDIFSAIEYLPASFVDLLFIDPPYNLRKTFKSNSFQEMKTSEYADWVESWLSKLVGVLKPTASIYICGDWKSSGAIQQVAEKYFTIRNRITWEREKGRGAKANWKNNSEDIWFCTVSNSYYFDVQAVKLKRKVLAPYTHKDGKPKDWEQTEAGNYRLTSPSNVWTDLTVPFWSMPENTEHPTQKPEKLLAKIILASSKPGDMVFDPFCGSGTTPVVAKKLGRHFCGIELDRTFACIAMKRLTLAKSDASIQGYFDGVFWERNTLKEQKKLKK